MRRRSRDRSRDRSRSRKRYRSRSRSRDRRHTRDNGRRTRDNGRRVRDTTSRRSDTPSRRSKVKRSKSPEMLTDEFGRQVTAEQMRKRKAEERARDLAKIKEEQRYTPAEREEMKRKEEMKQLEGLTEEEKMMRLMGFGDFNTTKGQKVEDNVQGASKGAKAVSGQRTYRQYMNRAGGFNRILDPVADSKGKVTKSK